jgi:hypothetical protein
MLVLRWLLGLTSLGVIGAIVLLVVVARDFRRSFGSTMPHPLLVGGLVLAVVVMFAGVLWPQFRPLLHAGAACASALSLLCLWDHSPFGLAGLLHCGLWLLHYGLLVGGRG